MSKLFCASYIFFQCGLASACLLVSQNAFSFTKTLRVAFANTLAPWVIESDNSGFLVELTEDCLSKFGYKIDPVYYPYKRRLNAFISKEVDVTIDINLNTLKQKKIEGYFSGLFYKYENFAIALSKNNLNLKKLSDLKDLSIIAWHGAKAHLGKEYTEAVAENPKYIEIHDQFAQVKMLFLGRTQVIQIDKQIFDHYHNILRVSKNKTSIQPVDFFPLFGPSPNGFMFRSKKVRDDFLKGLNSPEIQKKWHHILYKSP